MKNHNIIKLLVIGLVTGAVVVFFSVILSDPYFFTPTKKLYRTGVAKMEEGILGNRNAYREAAVYFNALLDKGHTTKETFDRLYWCYRFAKDYDNAEKTLARALKVYPDDVEFTFHRAENLLAQKKYQLAIADYNKVISTGPNFKYKYDAIYSRGAAKYMLGEKDEAEKDRLHAMKLAPYELESYEEHFKTVE